jgi:4-hydroxy-tetrahydrodipicolinate reductase
VIDVVVSGAAGRLGRRIVALAGKAEGLRITAGLVRAGADAEGIDLGTLAGEAKLGVAATSNAEAAIRPGVVLIETAVRSAVLAHAALAASVRAPMLIATTGLDRAEVETLQAHASACAVLIAPNLSLGIAVLTELVAKASRALEGYHLELVELHHAKKRDAPSGTAWALARAAVEARGRDLERDAILARAGDIGPRGEHEIGIQSVRGGDIIGEHTLYLVSPTERLELTHRAQSRDTFAAGAVRAARFLGDRTRAPGLYTMRDVLGLN